MTFIQPQKEKNILQRLLALAAICTVFGALWLVVLYNTLVNTTHGISAAKSKLANMQAENLTARNKVFDVITNADPAALGLVQDRSPEYVEIRPQWSYVSGY